MNTQNTALFLAVTLMAINGMSADAQNTPPRGFSALFNSRNLDGWRGGSTVEPRRIEPAQQAAWDAEVTKHWRVEDGQLVSDGEEPHLVTAKEYGNFELWVDWKLAPKGDSGIYLRGCPQVQLWDPLNTEAHYQGSDKGSGALWNNEKHERFPTEVADKPTGQWNHMYIRMVGEYVMVVLNDKTVVENVPLENYYDRNSHVPDKGPIHLQTHGSESRFRDLFIREIPPDEAHKLLLEHGLASDRP